MEKNMAISKKSLGIFALTMINFAAIMNLRNLPLLSFYGLGMIVFYLIAALLFFVPTALISAELASIFPEEGGLFLWVNRAIGSRVAFLCEWIGFITTVTALTATVVFLVTSMLLAVSPSLSQNKTCVCLAVIGSVWTATFLALRGTTFASKIISVASTIGTLLPVFVLGILGAHWLCSGHPIAMDLSLKSLWPDLSNFSNVSFLAGIMFAFAGIEMSAYYVKDVDNPCKTYPRAIFWSTSLILIVSLLGSLAIAVVVPAGELRLEVGVMQAMAIMLDGIHLGWLAPLLGFLMLIGGISYVFAWIAGPVRGLYAARSTGFLPPFLQKTDKLGMPISILYYQAIMVTILALLFLFFPSISLCFWIINASASIMMLVLYACLFAAGIILRYKMPNATRLYRVPGGNFGMILLGSAGILNVIFCIIVSFFIPREMQNSMPQWAFALIISATTFLLICPPFIFIAMRRPHWVAQ
ncbi:MAG: APC family permease [Puniceicoccales bacterium]|jgi:amino acid transporter|nr:APC family permease [Puniceicoccales bacterium]